MPTIPFANNINSISAFGNDVVKVMAYGQKVYEKQPSPDYLCFTALESGTFTLSVPASVTSSNLSYVEYSLDGRNWTRLTVDDTSQSITTPTIPVGRKVYWRGSGIRMTAPSSSLADCSHFTSDDGNGTPIKFNLSGCVYSLLTGSNLNMEGTSSYTFCQLFNGAYVVDASAMYFTSGTGQGRECREMFKGCTYLEKAPLLDHAKVGNYCYYQMFNGCNNLSYVKCLATDISGTYCLSSWLNAVSATGVFIQMAGVTYPRNASGIPTGWVAIEKRTMPTGYKQVGSIANPNLGYITLNRAFESNAETLEIAFVKQATGASQSFGNTTYNYRYGSVKVTEQATALALNVGVDFANQVNKVVTIASVSADEPHTLQYVGSSSGFQLYLDGVSKSTQTCAWDAVNPFASNMVFSASTNTSNTVYFHTLPIYYVKIWDGNGVLALDYVASIRESDNVAGFYDMVGGVFHPSENTNNFTAGEKI